MIKNNKNNPTTSCHIFIFWYGIINLIWWTWINCNPFISSIMRKYAFNNKHRRQELEFMNNYFCSISIFIFECNPENLIKDTWYIFRINENIDMFCYNSKQIKRYRSSINVTSCSKKSFLQEIILIVRVVTVLE